MIEKIRKLQGIVREIKATSEKRKDEEGEEWEKCVYIVELKGFSRRVNDRIPVELVGKVVKVERWALFDWHRKTGGSFTFTPEETEKILKGGVG